MSSEIPALQTGLSLSATERRFIQVPVANPQKGEVLVKNYAVASNPKDWKYPIVMKEKGYDFIEGNDVAGTIVAIGEGVTEFKVGDKVAGFSQMVSYDNKTGAYQQYTIVPENSTFSIPENISFEDASTLPLAILTSSLALFHEEELALPTPFEPASGDNRPTVVVNGASSSIGAYAVQLAKLAGLRVIGIAGSGAAYAKELGADVVIDYRNKTGEEITKELKSYGPFSHVYDGVSSEETFKFLCDSLKPAGGRITTILPALSKDFIKEQCGDNIYHNVTYVISIHRDNVEFGRKYARWYTKVLADGKLKPNKARIMPKGLESVPEGLDLLQNNKVSAEKLVYRIKDTPNLE